MARPWDPALLRSGPNCLPPPLLSPAVTTRLFPQLFKSSPYLKESIKPWLSHSPRQRSLHFKVAGCDAERESVRQRDTEREKTSGNSPTLRWLIYSSAQAAAVQRCTYKHIYTSHTNTLPMSLLGNLHKLTFNTWTLTLTLPIIHWPQYLQINNCSFCRPMPPHTHKTTHFKGTH